MRDLISFHPFLLSGSDNNTLPNALSTRILVMNTQIVLYNNNPRIYRRNMTMVKWFGKSCQTSETIECRYSPRIQVSDSTRGILLSKLNMKEERMRILAAAAIDLKPSLIYFGTFSTSKNSLSS